jgi:hypothetical protein
MNAYASSPMGMKRRVKKTRLEQGVKLSPKNAVMRRFLI